MPRTAGSLRAHRAYHVQREIGIAAQAVAPGALGHHDQHGVDAACAHVACDVSVVAADIALLGRRQAEHRPRPEVELAHANVRRQAARAQVAHVFELGYSGKGAAHIGLEKAPLELARAARQLERKPGDDREAQLGARFDASVQGIEQRHRLAEPQRRTADYVLPEPRQNRIDRDLQFRRAQPRHRLSVAGSQPSGGQTSSSDLRSASTPIQSATAAAAHISTPASAYAAKSALRLPLSMIAP